MAHEGDEGCSKGRSESLEYRAPEIWNYRKCGTEVDMWALGVLTYELLYGTMPFDGESVRWFWTKLKFRDDGEASKEAIDFIRRLLVRNAEKRMSSEEALKHRWLKVYAR